MATILLFIYVETESTRGKTGTLNLLLTVVSFYINNCLLFLMYQLVLWTIMKSFRGSMVSQVLQLHSHDFYWQRERVGGSWVFVAGNLDNASVSAADPGFPTGKGRAHYILPKFTETCT